MDEQIVRVASSIDFCKTKKTSQYHTNMISCLDYFELLLKHVFTVYCSRTIKWVVIFLDAI